MAEGYKNSNSNSNVSFGNVLNSSLRNSDNFSDGNYHQLNDERSLDFSYLRLDGLTLSHNLEHFEESNGGKNAADVQHLYMQQNRLDFIPENISIFLHLRHIDLSNNLLVELNEGILQLKHLVSLIAKNNQLGEFSLPKKLGLLQNLEELNLSGNSFRTVPLEILDVGSLRFLHLGANQLEELPRDICRLERLEGLYLGGNRLRDIPAEVGRLHQLRTLALCDNRLQSLPSAVSRLRSLCSLSLHRNALTTLPPEIVALEGLVELSLRDNPLVVRFVREMSCDAPSLRELAARTIKLFRVPYRDDALPPTLVTYLESARHCVNPECSGVYFDVRVERVKFVDFCGKYRLPLLQYLCSSRCFSEEGVSDPDVPESRMRRVLLG